MRVWKKFQQTVALTPKGLWVFSDRIQTLHVSKLGLSSDHQRGFLCVHPEGEFAWASDADKKGKTYRVDLRTGKLKPIDITIADAQWCGQRALAVFWRDEKSSPEIGWLDQDANILSLVDQVPIKRVDWPRGLIWKTDVDPFEEELDFCADTLPGDHDIRVTVNSFGATVSESSSGVIFTFDGEDYERITGYRVPGKEEASLQTVRTKSGILVSLCIEGRDGALAHFDEEGMCTGYRSKFAAGPVMMIDENSALFPKRKGLSIVEIDSFAEIEQAKFNLFSPFCDLWMEADKDAFVLLSRDGSLVGEKSEDGWYLWPLVPMTADEDVILFEPTIWKPGSALVPEGPIRKELLLPEINQEIVDELVRHGEMILEGDIERHGPTRQALQAWTVRISHPRYTTYWEDLKRDVEKLGIEAVVLRRLLPNPPRLADLTRTELTELISKLRSPLTAISYKLYWRNFIGSNFSEESNDEIETWDTPHIWAILGSSKKSAVRISNKSFSVVLAQLDGNFDDPLGLKFNLTLKAQSQRKEEPDIYLHLENQHLDVDSFWKSCSMTIKDGTFQADEKLPIEQVSLSLKPVQRCLHHLSVTGKVSGTVFDVKNPTFSIETGVDIGLIRSGTKNQKEAYERVGAALDLSEMYFGTDDGQIAFSPIETCFESPKSVDKNKTLTFEKAQAFVEKLVAEEQIEVSGKTSPETNRLISRLLTGEKPTPEQVETFADVLCDDDAIEDVFAGDDELTESIENFKKSLN